MPRRSDRDRILVQLIETVWDTALGLTVAVRQEPNGGPAGARWLTGVVWISGGWEGTPALAASPDLARTQITFAGQGGLMRCTVVRRG